MTLSSKSNQISSKIITRQRRRNGSKGSAHSALARVSIAALLNPNLETNNNSSMESVYSLNSPSHGLLGGHSAPITDDNQAAVPFFENLNHLQLPSITEQEILVPHTRTEEALSPVTPSVIHPTAQERSPLLREYKCNLCTKSFRFSGGLKQHVKAVHERIKDRQCPHPGCTKSYASGGDASRHFKSVHENLRPFQCDCGKTFTRSYTRKRHVKKKHCSL